MVNAFRHRDRKNIEIYVGNFEDIESSLPQFDVITLIGVLEYSASYLHTQEPYLQMLRAAWRHLKPEGRLILAIENKLWMKYWAGCREDHTGRLLDSIENYPGRRDVQTFSKKELEHLLQAAGYVMRDGERKWVEKIPLTREAAAHVERLTSSYEKLCRAYEGTRLRPCPVVVESGVARFEFLEGELFFMGIGEGVRLLYCTRGPAGYRMVWIYVCPEKNCDWKDEL